MSTSDTPSIDWDRVYPHENHRWTMGVRRGNLHEFFTNRKTTVAARIERSRWLSEDPETYSALLDEAHPALFETVALANSIGAEIDTSAEPYEQLLALGRTWEPDFAWMHPGSDGRHRLIGGVVCFPSMWALRDKIGLPMAEIHAPVPGLNDILAKPIELFMSRQRPGETWVRENMNFARDNHLNHHPDQPIRAMDETIQIDEFWLRMEHQLLLKLPNSGSILFGIHVELVPMATILQNPEGAQRLEKVFTTMSEAAAQYKGIAQARDTLIAICRAHQKK